MGWVSSAPRTQTSKLARPTTSAARWKRFQSGCVVETACSLFHLQSLADSSLFTGR